MEGTKTTPLHGQSHEQPYSPPCFSFFPPSVNHCPSAVHPSLSPPTPLLPNQAPTPHALSSATTTHPSLSLLHKLPVIDPGHIAVVFVFCVYWSLGTQGQCLMRPLQRPIDERPSVREDDPSQEHPELGISHPRPSHHTKTSTVDRDLKGHIGKQGERERGKRGRTCPGQTT